MSSERQRDDQSDAGGPSRKAQRSLTEQEAEARRNRIQELSGGAKREFETAEDDCEGWKEIEEGFELQGREEHVYDTQAEPDIDRLPADAGMNQEARGRPNLQENLGAAAENEEASRRDQRRGEAA